MHSTNDEAAVIRNPKQWDQHLFSHFHLSRYIGGFFFETIPTTIVEKITIFPLNKNLQHILYPPTQYLFREEKRSIKKRTYLLHKIADNIIAIGKPKREQ